MAKSKKKKLEPSAAKVRRGPAPRALFDDPDFALARSEALHRFAARPEIQGVSVGDRIVGGRWQNESALRIHVREKIAKKHLRKVELLPTDLGGIPVDVVQRVYEAEISPHDPRFRRRPLLDPLQPGIRVARLDSSAGTFGMVVFDLDSGDPCLLSAAHVLVGSFSARAGDLILQPDTSNGAQKDLHGVATLGRWVWERGRGDAAFARLTGTRRINPLPLGLQTPIRGARRPVLHDILVKSGGTTAVTRAQVESIADIEVNYPQLDRKLMLPGFELRTLELGNPRGEEISSSGDSGAIWYDEATGEAVGLHIGGEPFAAPQQDEHALACIVPDMLELLEVSITPTEKTGDFPFTEDASRVVKLL